MPLGLSDDIFTVGFVAVSVIVGRAVRFVETKQQRKWLSTFIGFALLCAACEQYFIYFIIIVTGNCLLVKGFPPSKSERTSLPVESFVWNFGNLAMFHSLPYFGFSPLSRTADLAFMFLTLKMVGLAFEIQDSFTQSQAVEVNGNTDQAKMDLQRRYCAIKVGPVDVFCYAFCYIGTVTGPYYKYRTYEDCLALSRDVHLNVRDPLMRRLKQLPVIAACHFFCIHFFSTKLDVESETFMMEPFWFRLFYMVPMYIIVRTTLYTGWILGQMVCMSAGLGAYPVVSKPKCGQGPSDLEQLDGTFQKTEGVHHDYNFETIHNVDIYGAELSPSFKQHILNWNRTVQYWMAFCVYRRLPSFLTNAFRVIITMTVSASWHGIQPGYFLCFLTMPLLLQAEDAMARAFRDGASPQKQKMFDRIHWFLRARSVEYMSMPFLLVDLTPCIAYWRSIYFIGHALMVIFLVLGTAYKPREKRQARD